ncbi:MAG: aminotransferase class III-fold pyridoxal phosphate-dependent enzyme [Bacillota bacterium]|nr:aminotransferase class III-fold pyridoxal phosphate-dependent enzyme [Bacillota bacterium]
MSTLRKDLLNPSIKKVISSFKLDKTYVAAEGVYLTDEEGNTILDFIAQYGAVSFGYNPAFVWEALDNVRKKKLPSLVQPSLPGEALKLANRLAELAPGDLTYCTFCQSGTEGVEASIKLARSTTGREFIVSTSNSFHGKTLGALSATGKDSYQTPFRAPAPGFLRIPFNDEDALEKVFQEYKDRIAGFIIEPVQGEGGIHVAKPGYLAHIQKLCNESGTVFIVDEVQSGMGRTGKLFACEHEGIKPDVMVLAKALGGGMLPMGVCMSSPRVWNEDFGMLHSSTFANNDITCSVGLSVLERLCEDDKLLIKETGDKGRYLLEKVTNLQEKYPGVIKEVRGLGLMVGMEFYPLEDCGSYDMSFIEEQGGFTALLAGFLLNVCKIRLAPFLNNSTTLRLEPALTISYEEMDRVLEALDLICKIMYYQDYALLYRYLVDDYRMPHKISDYRGATRKIKSSILQEGEQVDRRFAFIVHYPAPEDVILNNHSFVSYSRNELYDFIAWESQNKEPGLCCHMPAIKSKAGVVVEGWLIGVPFGAREIMQGNNEEIAECIASGVDKGKDLGADIVGLGALTSVVTRGGRSVTGRGVPVTSGNSFTTLMAVEALFMGAEKMNIEPIAASGGVVGATGSIGRACALMLSERLCQMTLFGNPEHQVSSKNRLRSLSTDIFTYAYERMHRGEMDGMSAWMDGIVKRVSKMETAGAKRYLSHLENGENLSLDFMHEVCDFLKIDYPLQTSLDIPRDLPDCNLVIATSNSPEYLISADDLQSGAVVCDVARPADVAPEVYAQRDDVLILEGGLVQYPDNICFGPNLGYRDGVNLACLSETVLLAMEGDCQDTSIGNKLSLETVHHLRELARRHGLSLAGLKMGNREITDADIDEIYRNSLDLKKAENL